MKEAARTGWLVSPAQQTAEKEADAQCTYHFWRGSKLQPAPEVGMVPKEEFHKDLESVRALLAQPYLILRFAATRPLSADMTGPTVKMLLELSLQDSRASQIMVMFRKWYALSAWLMVGARIRPARQKRSPLMKELQELAFSS